MLEPKSEKELAFLHDLFIAPDWGERFAELIDEHVKLPERGRAIYLNSGTGGHALALQERGGHELKWFSIDENHERLELGRAKAATSKSPAEFQQHSLASLAIEDDQFELALADGSLVAPNRLALIIPELVRVARPGALVAFNLVTSASFGEFFSIYWEALYNCGLSDQALVVQTLITELPIVSEIEELARLEGLADITSWTQIEEFDYESGKAFIGAPLISDYLMKGWLRIVPENASERVISEIVRLIDAERHDAEFSLTVKATLVVGKKTGLPLAG